ncbi:hypothetical protein POM88_041337 [Heracleum sosnowskyi]|uniref:CCHC-type domain-containing protein n=1 Tax=Heracleum sosnowskyi TaxID=360622 RepID=A0AAD8M9M1_9APIA|nr:hypothetical protein POM88_041337 [Heracleum sosnowskyi]
MTVAEYEAKFTELSRFVPEIVNTDLKKSRRFQQGLKQWIQNRVAVLEITDYASLVQKATIVESGNEQSQKGKEEEKAWRTENRSLSQGGRQIGVSHFNQPRPPLPDCKTCGRKHLGECTLKSTTCFKCNKTGHYSKTCLQKNQKCFQCGKLGHLKRDYPMANPVGSRISGAASNKPPTARTFNMTLKDAVRDPNVIAGTLLLNTINANVLFDSGATKSFISRDFASQFKLRAEPLKEVLKVEIANREVIPVDKIHLDCSLEIEGQQFRVDLIPFKLG